MAIREYLADPDVEYAEPNFQASTWATPDDPRQLYLWGMEKINTPTAWDMTTGSRDVVVVVVDTGIDYDHPSWASPTPRRRR